MKKIVILFVLSVYALTGIAQEADQISGIWWNDEKTTKIKVEKKEGKYVGTIVYMIPEKYGVQHSLMGLRRVLFM